MDDNETPDAQKKEAEEPIEDLTPEKDAMGGAPHVRVFDGRGGASLGSQKKEITGA